MKNLLTIIAAVVFVGCGSSVDIHKAAKEGNIEAVKQHIAAGTDVNAKDRKEGWTPLYWAVGEGKKKIVEVTVERGEEAVFTGEFICFIPEKHVLS